MTDRARRVAENEQRFRVFNDQVREVRVDLDSAADFACECGDGNCSARLDLSSDEYVHVRSDRRWFAVLPGHNRPAFERVVEQTSRYLVVEKTGDSAEHVE